uniref:Uncharacterized protein n=1 Tax=Gossypium raimondii TaxID=29730 RepID=A0A0D2QCC0_GOSRA|nr:hypothetical protein B456_002G260700 [Gossypium raimondii]
MFPNMILPKMNPIEPINATNTGCNKLTPKYKIKTKLATLKHNRKVTGILGLHLLVQPFNKALYQIFKLFMA